MRKKILIAGLLVASTGGAWAAGGRMGIQDTARYVADSLRTNRELRAANERETARFDLAMDAIKVFHGEVSEDLLLKNAVTGEGLVEALTGARVAVDVANTPSWEDKAVLEFFETSGRNLLAAEAAAGVTHHVALSVVGTERLLVSGYFRAKMAQEGLIKASRIPYTIVRATQFFEFVGGIAQLSTEGQTLRLPSALMQPIVSDDVAAILADIAVA